MKNLPRKFLPLGILVLALNGCSEPAGENDKATAPETLNEISLNKASTENGLRIRVHFLGEGPQTANINERLTDLNTPGISFALINDGKLEWAEGYGLVSAESDEEVGTSTMFQAASLSKPMTVITALRMREAGLIDFDKDIQTYFKEYNLPEGEQTPENPVTFRNLLGHTAGASPGGYLGYEAGGPVPNDLEILRGSPPANTEEVLIISSPNSGLSYSGGGYTMAELALQDVTNQTFEELSQTWLLKPLNLSDSTFSQIAWPRAQGSFAQGHFGDGTVLPGKWKIHPEQAAAGMWTTASDLAKIIIEIQMALKGDSGLLSQETARELVTEQMDGHAYGFILSGEGESFALRHHGGNEGFRSFFIFYPETGDGAVFLTNSNAGMDLGFEMLRGASATYNWPNFKTIDVKRMTLDQEQLSQLTGTYRFDYEIEVEITYEALQNEISMTFPNGDIYPLVPTGAQEFIHPESATVVSFSGQGETQSVTVYGDTARRVE